MKSEVRSFISDIFYDTFDSISRKMLINFLYKRAFGHTINWENPSDINEKINWLKLYGNTSRWPLLADKYRVRDYIKLCGYEDMLVPLLGVWDKADLIDWDKLPNQFAMKVNNGSGDVLICKDKNDLNIQGVTKYFASLLNKPYGKKTAEFHYSEIKPCIIAEELLDISSQPHNSMSLVDYKIWCFNGKPESVWVCKNRTKHKVETSLYDLNFNRLKQYEKNDDHYLGDSINMECPASFNYMLEAASKLSEGFPEVRVDFYDVKGKPYFGEITFTSMSGMMCYFTQEYLNILGDKCILQ